VDADAHLLGEGVRTLEFFVILDAVNFGSGWFPLLRKRPGCSGYFTVARALKDEFARNGRMPAERLAAMTADQCATLFGQDPGHPEVMELMRLFSRALSDLGLLLLRAFGGGVAAMVESAGGSAARLVGTLLDMPLYRDVSEYHGRRIPFLKRAQLTCADLWLAFGGAGWGRFDDIESLTIFADNLVPHVLRFDGVLRYEPDLARRIDAGTPIAAQSEEEIEIRACAVAAVEALVEELALAGHPTSARRLDYWLWSRGGRPEIKAVPRHRARTPFY
jgi:hypothetical protein